MKDWLKKHWLEILILTCAAMIVLFLSLYRRSCDPALGRDSVNYIGIIQLWHETGSIDGVLKIHPDFWFPPLSMFCGKILVDCGFSAESAAVGLNIFFACFLPLIAFGIAREITQNKNIALCSAILLSFNPTVIDLAVEAQRDMPYLFFCGLLLFFSSCAIRRDRWYWWGAAGAAFAPSFLLRHETLEMLPVFGIYLLVMLIIKKGERLKYLLYMVVSSTALAVTLLLLLSISDTTEYVKKRYQFYYEQKYELMQEESGGFNE